MKRIRIARGDRVEIIDKNSPHFGKTGMVIDITQSPLKEVNFAGKVIKTGIVTKLRLKIEGNDIVEITDHPNSLESQVKILKKT